MTFSLTIQGHDDGGFPSDLEGEMAFVEETAKGVVAMLKGKGLAVTGATVNGKNILEPGEASAPPPPAEEEPAAEEGGDEEEGSSEEEKPEA